MMQYAAGGSNTGISADTAGRLSIDLNDISVGNIANADSIVFIDADDNSTKKDSISDFLTEVAGTGLSVSSNRIVPDFFEFTPATVNTANDFFVFLECIVVHLG